MSAVNDLLDRAMQLSSGERADLAHRLLVSLEPGADAYAAERRAEWPAELQRRLDAADRGEFAEGDWRDVVQRVRQSLATDDRR